MKKCKILKIRMFLKVIFRPKKKIWVKNNLRENQWKVEKKLGVLGQNGEPFFWAFKPGDDWGYDKFLALDEIEKGGWLHGGKLVVTASNIRETSR